MASVEQLSSPAAGQNGNGAGIPVENPATGEAIATVPALSAEEVEELVGSAPAPRSRRGRRSASRSAASVLLRMQKWVTDNAERIIATIVSETGKTYEDAQFAEVMYARQRVRLLGQGGAELPRRRARQVRQPVRRRARS